MVYLDPAAFDKLVETASDSISTVTDSISTVTGTGHSVGNAALCADSLCTSGRAAINFYATTSPLARTFFGASVVFGVMGAASSATALATSYSGLPATALLGAFGARGFNRVGKYAYHMGNVTSGNITNTTTISEILA